MKVQERFEEILSNVQHDWAEWGGAQLKYNIKNKVAYVLIDSRDEYGEGNLVLYVVDEASQKKIIDACDKNDDAEFSRMIERYRVGVME